MASVIWSPRSLDDIEAISHYIDTPESRAAALFIQSIFTAGEELASFPMMGRVVSEFDRHELREVIVGSYRVIHLVENDVVFILTVHHGARPLRNSLL